MKKIMFLFLVLFSACVVKAPYVLESGIVDYSRYARLGLYITESGFADFEYDVIGRLYARVKSGNEVLNGDSKESDNIYADTLTGSKVKYGDYKLASVEALLDKVYSNAMEIGANGIISLEISPVVAYKKGKPHIIGYTASGLAIRRK